MEFLIDKWDWIKVHDLSVVGLIFVIVVVAGIIFRWDRKFKKPRK